MRGRSIIMGQLVQKLHKLTVPIRPPAWACSFLRPHLRREKLTRRTRRTRVLLLSHPSVQGMQSGTGLSGSTAWNNSVRSRLYFTADKNDEDLRLLKTMKANYGRKGAETILRWHEGAFILDDGKPSAHAALLANHADEVFLKMLSSINASGRRVSSSRSTTYVPTVMAGMPEREGTSKKALEEAMARLFTEKKIAVVKEGPPSRQRERLVVIEDEAQQKRMASG